MLRTNFQLIRTLKNEKYLIKFTRCQSSTSSASSLDDPKIRPNLNISTKTQRKLPARPPLVKNFLLGYVDKELLAYPEVIPRDDMAKLQKEIVGMKNYFDDLKQSEVSSFKSVEDEIKQLGLYGLNVPQHLGGRGYFWSESLIATEHEATPVSAGLLSHRTVVDVLNEVGTDSQKNKYLSKLADGSLIAAEAIYEPNVSQTELFNTSATYDPAEEAWMLNGQKSFAINIGSSPNLFLVIAQTQRPNVSLDRGIGSGIFLVDSSQPGVKIEAKLETFGLKEIDSSSVSFENVKVLEENVIEVYGSTKAAESLLKSSRLRCSQTALGLTKNIIDYLTEYCISNKHCGVPLKDVNLIRDRLAYQVSTTYAAESMLYMTVGLLDEFDGQDVGLEAAVTKYYTLNNLWKVACSVMDFLGPKTLLAGETTEGFVRDAAQLYTQGEAIDSLRLYIALSGLQHAGIKLNEDVQKGRNPLFHPNHIFSKFLHSNSIDSPRTKMQLGENLHPSLEPAAQALEHSIARLQMCVDLLLTRYGSEIVEKQVEITRIAEMISHTYAMFASVSRASRAYCIGLKLSDYEMLLATSICLDGRDKVKVLATEVFQGPYITNDNNLERISKQIFRSKGCFTDHPLTYNY